MASQEFLEEMLVEVKKYVPGWLYAGLLQAARPRSGGKAKANRARAQAEGISKAMISFVVSEYSDIEKARGEALVGATGNVFDKLYLDPLGIDRNDVHVTIDKDEIKDVNPRLVIALGQVAKADLGDWADYTLPHPEVVRKHGNSGEVGRKIKSIYKVLFDNNGNDTYFRDRIQLAKREPIVEFKADFKSVKSHIIKSASVKKIVYGVVMDPYGANGAQEDAHNDWLPPDMIEKSAHDYLKNSRVVGLQHSKKASANVVESFIEQYPTSEDYQKALVGDAHRVTRRDFGNDKIHSGSWVLGVELGDTEWDKYQKGEITAFSPGGYGMRQPISREEMPAVEFVDLKEVTND